MAKKEPRSGKFFPNNMIAVKAPKQTAGASQAHSAPNAADVSTVLFIRNQLRILT